MPWGGKKAGQRTPRTKEAPRILSVRARTPNSSKRCVQDGPLRRLGPMMRSHHFPAETTAGMMKSHQAHHVGRQVSGDLPCRRRSGGAAPVPGAAMDGRRHCGSVVSYCAELMLTAGLLDVTPRSDSSSHTPTSASSTTRNTSTIPSPCGGASKNLSLASSTEGTVNQ